MKGIGTDEDRNNYIKTKLDVKKIKEKYNKEFESDIQSDLLCDLERLLVSILQCKRSENNNPNQNECQKLA